MVGVTALSSEVDDFQKYAVADPKTGELYMSETEFVEAIAPGDEDYVRRASTRTSVDT